MALQPAGIDLVAKTSATSSSAAASSSGATNTNDSASIMSNAASSSSGDDAGPFMAAVSNVQRSMGTIQNGEPASVLADTIGRKAIEINESYFAQFLGLKAQCDALDSANAKNLTPEEISKKKAEINKKMEALEKEGKAKLAILATIGGKVGRLNSVMKKMQDSGLSTDEMTKTIDEAVAKISTSPSDINIDVDDKSSSDAKLDTNTEGQTTALQSANLSDLVTANSSENATGQSATAQNTGMTNPFASALNTSAQNQADKALGTNEANPFVTDPKTSAQTQDKTNKDVNSSDSLDKKSTDDIGAKLRGDVLAPCGKALDKQKKAAEEKKQELEKQAETCKTPEEKEKIEMQKAAITEQIAFLKSCTGAFAPDSSFITK